MKTAVERYAEEFAEHLEETYGIKITNLTLLNKAKEMEKEQKIEFACDVYDLNYGKDKSFRRAAEDYYNEIIK
jgi:hypothetical protein